MRLREVLVELYEEIRHGDSEHQAWLHDKILEFYLKTDQGKVVMCMECGARGYREYMNGVQMGDGHCRIGDLMYMSDWDKLSEESKDAIRDVIRKKAKLQSRPHR